MSDGSKAARMPSTRDGYVNSPLLEGHVNKGGLNPPVSQVTVRPPAPPPSNPPVSQGSSGVVGKPPS